MAWQAAPAPASTRLASILAQDDTHSVPLSTQLKSSILLHAELLSSHCHRYNVIIKTPSFFSKLRH